MEKRIKVKKIETVDLSPYFNIETGEFQDSEFKGKGVSIKAVKDSGKSIVTYSDYSVISSDAVIAMREVLNDSDMAKVLMMAVIAKTDLSILFNNTVPHTNKTLQTYLRVKSEAMYLNLIRRLMKAGILYQIKGLIWGEVRVIYMINPYLCRKRKIFENRVLDVFRKFNTENNPE